MSIEILIPKAINIEMHELNISTALALELGPGSNLAFGSPVEIVDFEPFELFPAVTTALVSEYPT